MKKQPEITAATRKAFVDAFCEFYRDKPVEKITIKEITNKADFNRSTFYQYFKDAYDLLFYLEDMVISYVSSFTDIQEEMKFYVEALRGNPNSTKFTERLKLVILPVFMEQFQIAKTDTKSVYVLEFYLSGLISMVKRWMQSGCDVPIEDLGRLYTAIF